MIEKLRTYTSASPDDTEKIAEELAAIFKAGDIILLEGNLGTGKTFLVQKICRFWNVEEEVTSPTFAIMQHYQGDVAVNHFDFYRLKNALELENLGWEEIAYGGGVTFIEWPQLVKDKIERYYLIKIEFSGSERQFELFKAGG
jgi:tRNA threonylcarbamoyl adenosine modification protein YjeE